MGIRLANQIVSSDVLELIEISPEYSVHQMKASQDMFDKTLIDLNLRRKFDAVVIAIKRKEGLIIIPSSDEKIHPDDSLIMIMRTANLHKVLHLSE